MKMLRLMLLLAVFFATLVFTVWYDYPFSDYGIGTNLVRTKGEILSTGVESGRSGSGRTSTTWYRPTISFKYEVNGTNYVSSRLSVYVATSPTEQEAAQRASRYKPGAIELVYFSPTNPKFALLDKKFPWQYLAGTVFSIACVGFIFIFGVLILDDDKNKKITHLSNQGRR